MYLGGCSLNEISVEIQQQIIKMVEERKKLPIGFISTITQIPKELIDTNAEIMGLISDGEFLLVTEKYNPVIFVQKISEFRDLLADFVFCPKCGTKNSFIDNPFATRHFCVRCSVILDKFWEDYLNGITTPSNCIICNQLTFQKLKYCISCGQMHNKKKIITKKQDLSLKRAIEENEIENPEYDIFGRIGRSRRLTKFEIWLNGFPKKQRIIIGSLIIAGIIVIMIILIHLALNFMGS